MSNVSSFKSNSIGIFGPRVEFLNLFFPFILVAICIWELINNYSFSPMEKNLGYMLSKGLFLNHLHTFFTVLMFMYFPEARVWYKQKTQTEKFYLLRQIVILFALFLFFYSLLPFLRTYSWGRPHLYVFAMSTMMWVGFHHVLTQSFGLSLVYNRMFEGSAHCTEPDKVLTRVLEKKERFYFRAMIFFVCIALYSKFHLGEKYVATQILTLCALICCIFLTLVVWRYPGAEHTNKRLFGLRYIFMPLAPISFVAYLSSLALHGVEYLFVLRKMYRNSSNAKKNIRWDYLGMAFISLVYFFLTIGDQFILGWWMRPNLPDYLPVLDFLAGVSGAYGYFHCHMDSALFRMSDPISRKVVAPLLLNKDN